MKPLFETYNQIVNQLLHLDHYSFESTTHFQIY